MHSFLRRANSMPFQWPATAFFSLVCAGTAAAQAPGNVRLDPTPTLQASLASTPVPSAQYRSVFADLPRGVEDTQLDWKAANAAVGQFKRGHMDLLKWEREQARQKAATQPGAQP
jgi:hypothetical protein